MKIGIARARTTKISWLLRIFVCRAELAERAERKFHLCEKCFFLFLECRKLAEKIIKYMYGVVFNAKNFRYEQRR